MRRTGPFLLALLVGLAVGGVPAQAAPVVRHHRPIVSLGANRSSNWSGFNQGSLEEGGVQFHGISGLWVVPTATQHAPGEAEYSSSWIGIGGGCVDAGCQVTDATLIQTGTEQDVDENGAASYSAWWELIPAPSVQITSMTIHAGDRMAASIVETPSGSEIWTMTIKDITTGQSFTQTVPYSSTHATAEWIEETPVVIDNQGNVTIGPLPDLSTVHFRATRVNGANAGLKPSEALQLYDSNSGTALATPSRPNRTRDGFNDCTYATSCPAPRI